MGTRTIRVREEVYERLKARKREDESFSELLDRLTDRGTQFEEGYGAMEDVNFEGAIDELDRRMDSHFKGDE